MFNSLSELKNVNNNNENITNLINLDGIIYNIEEFLDNDFVRGYLKVIDIFNLLQSNKIKVINRNFDIILSVGVIFIVFLTMCIFFLVYYYSKKFNILLNFIGILPLKYLYEDKKLYNCIIRIEEEVYDY